MATQTGGKRPFPAVVIVFLLFGVCVFPGQAWVAHGLPGLAGLVTLTPTLIVLDIPVHLPFIIDGILVPGLFILSYFVVIVFESVLRRVPLGQELAHRLGTLLAGSFLLGLCGAVGAGVAYGAQAYLPARIQKGLESLGINGDLYSGGNPVHLHGNLITLLALAIGLVLFINKVKKAPETKRTVQLTREQRMTPYQRMMAERRAQKATSPRPKPILADKKAPDHSRVADRSRCSHQPLLSLQPEAVNYRPM